MIYTREFDFSAGETAVIETDPQSNFYQLIASGGTVILPLEAQTSDKAPFESVFTDNSGTTQVILDTSAPLTKTIERTKIVRFRLIPSGGGNYHITLNQWRG